MTHGSIADPIVDGMILDEEVFLRTLALMDEVGVSDCIVRRMSAMPGRHRSSLRGRVEAERDYDGLLSDPGEF